MAVQLLFRLLGMILFAVLGWQFGLILVGTEPSNIGSVIAMSLLFSGIGLVVMPWLTIYPYRRLRDSLKTMPAEDLVSAISGLIIGLVISALLSIPLSLLPSPLREILIFLTTLLICYISIATMLMRRRELQRFIKNIKHSSAAEGKNNENDNQHAVLLDTSAIIDGRVADVSRTGFIFGTIIVPRFVLNELQHIADSPEPLRRNRGRRGLDMLSKLQKESVTPVHILDYEIEEHQEVDEKLITLAKRMSWPVVTNDINLNRVAQLQGVNVLNINELANAVKTVVLPGEMVHVRLIQEGKELGQGVGYLDDGTMVVVENSRRYLSQSLDVVVTKVLQTAAGRMIFAQIIKE